MPIHFLEKYVPGRGISSLLRISEDTKKQGETNSFMDSLDDYVASAYSNGHSACGNSTVHIPQFIVSTLWVVSFSFLWHPVYDRMSDHEIGALCCISSVVGGLLIFLHNFLVRAESDLLSSYIALYKYAQSINHPYHTIFPNFLEIPKYHHASLAMLLYNPYCLQLFRPKAPTLKL